MDVFSTRSMESSAPTFTVPAELFSDRSGALECILGDRVASSPWTTERMVSFTSRDVGSDSSATCIDVELLIVSKAKTKEDN